MRKFIALALTSVMALGLFACTSGNPTTTPNVVTEASKAEENKSESKTSENVETPVATAIKKIGVTMPTKDLQRWNQDGANMKAQLEAAGFEVDLQYANNDITQQVNQLENQISGGCQVLVIASIDGSALSTVLQQAKSNGIPVIAYDRLIMNSDAVSYYATFDNYKVGKMQGDYITERLDLKNQAGPFNIELFTGSSDDNNVNFFFGGAMDVLIPYIDEGKLLIKSGSRTLAECATPNWSTEEAQKRMENIISAYYSDGTKLDAVLSSNDSVANGITNALVNSYKGDFPVLTGQDCDITSVKNILADRQSMSIFKDTRELATQVVTMINALAKGEKVPVNDEKTYDNGTGVIPTFLCEPIYVDKSNYVEYLITSGYYKEDQLK